MRSFRQTGWWTSSGESRPRALRPRRCRTRSRSSASCSERIASSTRSPGYVLRVEPGELDLHRFERLLQEARQQEPDERLRTLSEALALWRGPPLADFETDSFAQADARRLEELRLIAAEDRVDAALENGAESQLVGELELLVSRHPLRERLRGQLMLALYCSGRQAEVLEAYQAAR